MNENFNVQNNPSYLERLMKPSEVARLLGISRSFTYHLLQTGAIPTVRLGRACRVRPQDLAAFIERSLHNGVNIP